MPNARMIDPLPLRPLALIIETTEYRLKGKFMTLKRERTQC